MRVANQKSSIIHSHIDGRNIRPLEKFNAENYASLRKIGINIGDAAVIRAQAQAYKEMRSAFDSLESTVTLGSVTTPIQFLQNWLPGFVKVITAARKIDKLVGISTIGAWEDQEVIQGILELTGLARPYGDYTNVNFSSWNTNFVRRTIIQFEQGLEVNRLEEARAARINIDQGAAEREAAALALEIVRNLVGFFGYNSGANNTYGFLNDPGLPAYVPAATGVSGSTLWSRKTFLEIVADIRTMVSTLRTQSLDQIDPEEVPMTLALATNVVDYLTTVSDFGISVREWMAQTYPKIRVESAPELDSANGGQNVGYLYADKINDLSTDDNRTFIQMIPAKFLLIGVAKTVKGYQEDYSNATAGVMCKRPWAVTRITHI